MVGPRAKKQTGNSRGLLEIKWKTVATSTKTFSSYNKSDKLDDFEVIRLRGFQKKWRTLKEFSDPGKETDDIWAAAIKRNGQKPEELFKVILSENEDVSSDMIAENTIIYYFG